MVVKPLSDPVRTCTSWLAVGNRLVWLEVGVALAWLLGAAAWHANRSLLSLPKQLALAALLLVAGAVLLRHGWFRLSGPVLFFELVRLGRRSRYFLLRSVYALTLLIILYFAYEWFLQEWQRNVSMGMFSRTGRLWDMPWQPGGSDLARLAEWFFTTFMVVQFFAVLLLTPAYTAGAIAEEKERKTLEFLLATDLEDREIVLSKLLARIANMLLIVLAGMPILSLTQFLGGVDPNLVAAGFAATGLTILSLSSFSILCSVFARKVRDALVLSYLGVAGYLALTHWLGEVLPVGWLARAIHAGNLYDVMQSLRQDFLTGKDLGTVIPPLLRGYAVTHLAFALLFITPAVVWLRALGLQQRPIRIVTRQPGLFRRPRVGQLPMIWKEVFTEPTLRLNRFGWIVVAIAVFLSLLPAAGIVWDYSTESIRFESEFTERINGWVRWSSTAVACLLLVGVAVRGAGAVSGERERETLDSLLTSPLDSHDILFGKWLGCFLCMRWGLLWLGLIWGIGIVAGGLNPLGVFMMLLAWIVYAAAIAGIAIWFSTACRTTARATLWTLGLLGAACLTPLVLCMPPVILYLLSPTSYQVYQDKVWDVQATMALIVMIFWSFVAALCWSVTRRRFREVTARMPHRRPELYRMSAKKIRQLAAQRN